MNSVYNFIYKIIYFYEKASRIQHIYATTKVIEKGLFNIHKNI